MPSQDYGSPAWSERLQLDQSNPQYVYDPQTGERFSIDSVRTVIGEYDRQANGGQSQGGATPGGALAGVGTQAGMTYAMTPSATAAPVAGAAPSAISGATSTGSGLASTAAENAAWNAAATEAGGGAVGGGTAASSTGSSIVPYLGYAALIAAIANNANSSMKMRKQYGTPLTNDEITKTWDPAVKYLGMSPQISGFLQKGSPAAWALKGIFGSTKSEDQIMRDRVRHVLQENGILDENYQYHTAKGGTVDLGLDGHAAPDYSGGRAPYQVNSDNPLSPTARTWGGIMASIVAGPNKKVREWFTGYFANALMSDAQSMEGVRANALDMMQKFKLDRAQVEAALKASVPPEELDAYMSGLNTMITGDPKGYITTADQAKAEAAGEVEPTTPGVRPPVALPPAPPVTPVPRLPGTMGTPPSNAGTPTNLQNPPTLNTRSAALATPSMILPQMQGLPEVGLGIANQTKAPNALGKVGGPQDFGIQIPSGIRVPAIAAPKEMWEEWVRNGYKFNVPNPPEMPTQPMAKQPPVQQQRPLTPNPVFAKPAPAPTPTANLIASLYNSPAQQPAVKDDRPGSFLSYGRGGIMPSGMNPVVPVQRPVPGNMPAQPQTLMNGRPVPLRN